MPNHDYVFHSVRLEGTVEQLELGAMLHCPDRAWRDLDPDVAPLAKPPQAGDRDFAPFTKSTEYINGLQCTMECVDASMLGGLEPLGFCSLRKEGPATFVDLRSTRFL